MWTHDNKAILSYSYLSYHLCSYTMSYIYSYPALSVGCMFQVQSQSAATSTRTSSHLSGSQQGQSVRTPSADGGHWLTTGHFVDSVLAVVSLLNSHSYEIHRLSQGWPQKFTQSRITRLVLIGSNHPPFTNTCLGTLVLRSKTTIGVNFLWLDVWLKYYWEFAVICNVWSHLINMFWDSVNWCGHL